MTWRRALAVFGGVLAVVCMAALGAAVALFAPVFLDDRALDRIVAVVVMDWRDFGRDTAQDRLMLELDKGRIGPWVGDSTCTLDDSRGMKEVRCVWDTTIIIPLVDRQVPLSFSSYAAVDAEGRLR